MSLLKKIAIQVVSLAVLALYARSTHGGAVPAAEPVVRPTAATSPGVSVGAAPAASEVVLPATSAAPQARSAGLLVKMGYAAPHAGVPVMVIPAKEMDAEAFRRIVTDLRVMSRILEKSIRDAPALQENMMMRQLKEVYGADYASVFGQADRTVPRMLQSSNGRPRPMYVGGYGAVFSLQVDFPLVPPPEMPRKDEATEQADQVWAQAQRELLDPQAAARAQRGAPEAEPYKPEVVDGLKNALTTALKHATNIRDLEAEAWLTILVQGPAPTAQGQPQDPLYGEPSPFAGPQTTARTLLTLRARKADIDQYAKGQLDDAQFQQRVQVVTY